MSNCTAIESNPDVSGIGIRVNLYITMLLVAIIPEVEATIPLLHVLITNAGISGVALLVTAIVQAAQNKLSLYHAIFIVHILFFTGVLVAPAGRYEGSIRSQLRRAIISITITYGSVLLFTGCAFYLWAKAPTFGPSAECNNQIKYIFFFVSVRATVGWLRKLWMAGLGITLSLLILSPIAGFLCTLCGGRGSISRGSSDGDSSDTSKGSKFLAGIYGVAMLELYEKRNQHLLTPGENQWTFGQIFALVQVISAFNEVFHFLLSCCSGKDDDEEESLDFQRRQVDSAPANQNPPRVRLPKFLTRWRGDKAGGNMELQNTTPTANGTTAGP